MQYWYSLLFLFLILSCNSQSGFFVEQQKYDNGKVKSLKTYKTKDKHQLLEEITYYDNGKIQMEGKYVNNKRTGKWVAYYSTGKTWSIAEYKDGLRQGIAKVYYPNGNLRYLGQYKEDKKDGLWKFYDGKNTVIEIKQYKNGIEIPIKQQQ